jgi:hypothetical protein
MGMPAETGYETTRRNGEALCRAELQPALCDFLTGVFSECPAPNGAPGGRGYLLLL